MAKKVKRKMEHDGKCDFIFLFVSTLFIRAAWMIVCGNNFSAIEFLFLSIAAAIGNRHGTGAANVIDCKNIVTGGTDSELLRWGIAPFQSAARESRVTQRFDLTRLRGIRVFVFIVKWINRTLKMKKMKYLFTNSTGWSVSFVLGTKINKINNSLLGSSYSKIFPPKGFETTELTLAQILVAFEEICFFFFFSSVFSFFCFIIQLTAIHLMHIKHYKLACAMCIWHGVIQFREYKLYRVGSQRRLACKW